MCWIGPRAMYYSHTHFLFIFMCSVKLEVEGFMGIRAPHKVDPSVAPIPLKPMHPTPPPPQGLNTVVWKSLWFFSY
jgi:hypothetical protein